MSCQRVVSLLSAYIDGEVEQADVDLVGEHLRSCTACAREYQQLRHTAAALSKVPEVEPPASLLDRIEAATVKRPTFQVRLRTAFGAVPQYARWAAGGAAIAGVLLAGLLLHLAGQRVADDLAGPPSGQEEVIATEPSGGALGSASEVGAADTKRHVGTRRAARAKTRQVVSAALGSLEAARSAVDAEAPTESVSSDEAVLVAELPEDSDRSAADGPASDSEAARLARAMARQNARLEQEADALERERMQLASRGGSRRNETYADRVQGRKYSVGLASIRF